MKNVVYTPDGEKITMHDHDWVMVDVTTHLNGTAKAPIAGATVLWRCTRRQCQGYRTSEYEFRKPRVNQQPNTYSPTIDSIMVGGLRHQIHSEMAGPLA